MAWIAPRTYMNGETLDKTIMDAHWRDNLLWLKGRADAIQNGYATASGSVTTTSTTYVDMTSMSVSVTPPGTEVFLFGIVEAWITGGTGTVQIMANVGGSDVILAGQHYCALADAHNLVPLFAKLTGLTAGAAVTIKLRWKTTGYTAGADARRFLILGV